MELLPYPEEMPKGWIKRLLDLLRGSPFNHVEDFHFLWHVAGVAAGKMAKRGELPPDFSGSDLPLHFEWLQGTDVAKGMYNEAVVVEREPNWGVVATACRKLHSRMTGGTT